MILRKSFVFISILTLLFIAGCSSSKAVKKVEDDSSKGAKISSKDFEFVSKDDLTDAELDQVKKVLEELADIPFDFDSYSIPTEGLEIIKKDVEILNQMLAERGKYIRITIEGHADERGSDEYNLALGERRAKTVQNYLVNVGFKSEALQIISYGEERPKVAGNTVESWAANRRVHMVVE
jgi:peptidoglycan-associated lipoprotein